MLTNNNMQCCAKFPSTLDEIVEIVKVSECVCVKGAGFSSGGHTETSKSAHSVQIDMSQFNKIVATDVITRQITVEAGITWYDVQHAIDPLGLSIKNMQSYVNFSVGGSVSVNCHGRYLREGPLVYFIVRLLLVLANGEIVIADRFVNADLFYAAVGGYGGIGVIAHVTLQLTANEILQLRKEEIPVEDYHYYFNAFIKNNKQIVMHNATLNARNNTLQCISFLRSQRDRPSSRTKRIRIARGHHFVDRGTAGDGLKRLQEPPGKAIETIRRIAYWSLSVPIVGNAVRQYVIDPLVFYNNKTVWRNYEAGYNVADLEKLHNKEYRLQEYFIPATPLNYGANQIGYFLYKMQEIHNARGIAIVNVSVRHCRQDAETVLRWAETDVYSVVLYYHCSHDGSNQKEGLKSKDKQSARELIDIAVGLGGSFYLPYDLHATAEQFHKAYPNAYLYKQIKNRIDPSGKLSNRLLEKYIF